MYTMSWNTFVINTLRPSNAELRSVIENALWKNYKNVQVTLTTCPAFAFGPCACPASVAGTAGELVADANFAESKIASKATIQQGGHTSPYKSLTIDSPKFNLMANLAISEEPGPAEVVHIKCSERIGEENLPGCIRKGLARHYGQSCVSLAGIFLLLRGEADVHIVPDYPPASFKTMDEMSWKTFVINTLKPTNAELRSVIETALWKNFKNVQVTLDTCPDLTKSPFRMTGNGFGRKLSIAEVGGMGNLFPILHKDKDYDIKVEKWLQRFEVKAPLVCATVFHSYDPGFNLRMEHTHCYSDHDDG
ncbi:hypothetical protein TELCIR_14868, partial [Teladorsagia circumcincta]